MADVTASFVSPEGQFQGLPLFVFQSQGSEGQKGDGGAYDYAGRGYAHAETKEKLQLVMDEDLGASIWSLGVCVQAGKRGCTQME